MFFMKLWYNEGIDAVISVELIPGSSMVEQEAVNFEVTGSSPVRGAKILPLAKLEAIFLLGLLGFHDTIILMIGSLCGKGV